MAFATNSAAFGIKSTAPTNSTIFGNDQASKPTGSIFGAPQQQQQPSTFGSNLASQPQGQQSTSLFGGGFGQSQQQQQPVTGGSFGQPQQPATTNLFGQPQQQPATTSLFGQPQQQTASTSLFSQPQQQPAITSLFGQPQQQPTSVGLFGQPQQQPATTSLFGQPQQQQQNAFGNSLFGGSTNNQAGQQQSTFSNIGFGNTTRPQQANQWGTNTGPNPLQPQATLPAGNVTFGTFGGGTNSLFSQRQQPSAATQQSSGPPLFTKSTKFNDLPDELKKILENIDSHIQGRVQISKELQQRKLGDESKKGQESIRSIHKNLVNTSSIIHSDALFTRDLNAKTDQAVQDTIIATRIVDGFRNPQQNGAYLKNHATFPLEYFTRITEQMKERLQWYKSTIEQIERKLSSSATQAQYTPQAISTTLQAQHSTFIALAVKTAALDAELQKIKTLYTQLWRAKTGSMRDPFNDLDRGSGGDFGLSSLNVA